MPPTPPVPPDAVDLVVEVPLFSFVKWGADGGVDFVSPVPCPFNYGSAVGAAGADGDPADVVWLGPRQARGTRSRQPVRCVVRFIDGGLPDDKWVCSDRPLRRRDRVALAAFFRVYALLKRATGRGPSTYGGIHLRQSAGTGA
jgi:inorganic pyrophosphatase